MDPLRVLIVDDEPGMRMAVVRTLERYAAHLPDCDEEVRFRVEQADSGEEALARILAEPPDLILLDHKLPGMTGLDLLNNLAGRDLDMLTVMITAYASLETAVIATKRGAYDFLAKPFTPEELKAALRKASNHLLLQRRARKLAEEKRQIRFQFISVLVHELKAPLAAIEGYLYVMKNRYSGDSLDSYEKAIERSLVRVEGMRKLILDLLDLTRLESGQKKREFVPVDLREIAQASIDTVTPDAQARRIAITLATPEAGPVPFEADRGEMEIILNNLITNAVKYNRDDGKVEVAIESGPDGAVVRVRDTGIGLTPAEAARLFQEFVRIKNDETRNVLGSGLGLSIVRKIAHAYRGEATVESERGVGSTFTVTLRWPEPAPGAQTLAGAPAAAAGAAASTAAASASQDRSPETGS
ncbi:MAG: sensor histidine kinase [Candidatus Eisenbacteria bacterium]|nr:hybrid sensor histidine kinase/response regulator [Candidatus Eisenbacteria bacterium]